MGGYLRSLQISRHQLFAFVEGTEVDPFFFGEVCRVASEPRGLSYRVRSAKELSQAGGKQTLLNFYRFVKKKHKLQFTFGGKTTLLVFYLDKDVDDLTRRLCRSRHVYYTRYYDVQNHVFKHANLLRGAATAASLDPVELSEVLPTLRSNWCEGAVRRWREWLVSCVIAVKHRVPVPNYRVLSQLNTPLNGPVDPAQYQLLKVRFAGHLGLSLPQMERRFTLTTRKIDERLACGTVDCVFKGKWYASILAEDLNVAFSHKAFQSSGLANRLPAALAATLNFSEPWADTFVGPLRTLLDEAL
jgi:hypothetical protein